MRFIEIRFTWRRITGSPPGSPAPKYINGIVSRPKWRVETDTTVQTVQHGGHQGLAIFGYNGIRNPVYGFAVTWVRIPPSPPRRLSLFPKVSVSIVNGATT